MDFDLFKDAFDALMGPSDSESAQNLGNDQRDVLYQERTSVTSGLDTEYSPKSVHGVESFATMSHADIVEFVDSMKPEQVDEVARAWRAIATGHNEATDAFRGKLRSGLAGWEGSFADAATAGVGVYTANAEQLRSATQLVANKVDEFNTGLRQTKSMMPPVSSEPGFAETLRDQMLESAFPSVGVLKQLFHEEDSAELEARRIMTTVYTPVVHQADDQVPILPVVHNPVSGPQPGGIPGGWQPSIVGYGGGPGDSPVRPGADPSSIGSQSPSDSAAEANPLSGVGEAASDGGSALSPAASTAAASTNPPAGLPLTGSTTGASGAGGGGFGGGSGSGGSGIGAGSAGYGGVPLAANPGGGAPGAGTAGRVGGGPGGGPQNGRSMMPMGMGGMGGARAQGGEDEEHKTPSYLVNIGNGNALIGDMPAVAPPVLGA